MERPLRPAAGSGPSAHAPRVRGSREAPRHGAAVWGSGPASRQVRGLLGRTWQATETDGQVGRPPRTPWSWARLLGPQYKAGAAHTHRKALADSEPLARVQSVPQSTGPPSLIAAALHTDVPSGILTRCLNDTSQSDVQMAEPRDPLKCRQAGDGAGEGYTATSGTHVDWQGSAALLLPVNLLEPSLPCWRVRGQWRHLRPSPTPPSRLEPPGHWLLAPGP